MRPRPLYEPRVRMRNEAEKPVATPAVVVTKKPEESSSQSKSFGGFSKGFLLSNSTSSTPKKTKKKDAENGGSGGGCKKTASAKTGKDDIPFLKAQEPPAKAPVLPEVQEAMKEAYSLMDTQGE